MKDRSFWNSIRRFKLRSVFVHYYAYILLLAFLMNTLFSVYIYRVHIQNLKASQDMALSAFLTQVSEETDSSVRLLYENILSISKDPLIAKTVIAPSMENSTRNAEIAQKLNSSALNFDYINKLYLYESTSDMLFTSDEKLVKKDESSDRELINIFLTDKTPCFDESIRQEGKLISNSERLYMVCRFVPVTDNYIGLIAAELNTDKLFSGLRQTLRQTDYDMTVQMQNGTILLTSGDTIDKDTNSVAQVWTRSGLTNWTYTVSSPSVSGISPGQYIRSILPFLSGMLLLSLLVSFFVTGYVYKPIHRLLFLVEDQEHPAESRVSDGQIPKKENTAFSELDILSSRYTRLASENRAAETFIMEVRPELESKLILDIIHGNTGITEEVLDSQLKILNSSIDPNGKYQCFKVKLTPLDQSEQLVYYMAYHQVVQKLTELFRQNQDQIYFLFFHDETFSFAVQFHRERKESDMRGIRRFLINELQEQFGDISEEVLVASGPVCDGLGGLSVSYYKAKEELRKLIYYGQDMSEDRKQGGFYDIQLDRIRKALEEDRLEDISHISGQMLDKLCVPETDMGTLQQYCSALTDVLLEKLYAFPSNNTEDVSEYKGLYQRIGQQQDMQELYQFMKSTVDTLVGRLGTELNKRQNKIIAGAKEFIQLNYADSSLSIHDIAEAVGITDTYLSSIFTEYTGENLVTCLNRYRVDMAKELLLNTNIIIKDVGFKTGFYTIQNFNRVFKRFTGSTPGEYRKQNK